MWTAFSIIFFLVLNPISPLMFEGGKHMRKINKMVYCCFIGFVALALAGCNDSGDDKIIRVTDNQFDSQGLHNAIAKIIVEKGFEDYTFETSTGSSTMNWQSIIAGDIDLDIESWTENVATYEEDVKSGDIVDVGVLVPDSQQGYYVPRYVVEGDKERGIEAVAPDLKTVADLKNYSHLFMDDENPDKGRVYGAIPGWMIDEVLFKKFEYHNLGENYTYFRVGNEATLFASLASAYNLKEPWVGYCYEPTWVAGKLDLIRLTDEPYNEKDYQDGKTDFPLQKLKIVSNGNFKEKAPEIHTFFSKFQTGSEIVNAGLAYMDDKQATHEEAAIWLLKENDKLLDDWLKPDQAKKVREYLESK